MAAQVAVASENRELFEIIALTAFCNPFSAERAVLDAKIVGHSIDPLSESHLEEMTRIISARVEALERKKLADVRKYSTRDCQLLRIVFLVETFHFYCHDFDRLILEQTKLGPESAPL